MTALEILNMACKLLDIDVNFSSDQTGDYNLLVMAVNDTLSDIFDLYLPIKREKQVTSSSLKIMFSAIDNDLSKIFGVEQNGIAVDYDIMQNYIKVQENGTYNIIYSTKAPAIVNQSTTLDLPPNVNVRVVAYGTASVFALCRGRYEDCVKFQKKYEELILALTRKPSAHIKGRAFV